MTDQMKDHFYTCDIEKKIREASKITCVSNRFENSCQNCTLQKIFERKYARFKAECLLVSSV